MNRWWIEVESKTGNGWVAFSGAFSTRDFAVAAASIAPAGRRYRVRKYR